MSVNERLARIEQKLDDMIGAEHARHEEQRTICETHNKWTASVQKDVDELKSDRAKVFGAAKLLVWLGSGGTLAGLIVKLLHHKPGGTP